MNDEVTRVDSCDGKRKLKFMYKKQRYFLHTSTYAHASGRPWDQCHERGVVPQTPSHMNWELAKDNSRKPVATVSVFRDE